MNTKPDREAVVLTRREFVQVVAVGGGGFALMVKLPALSAEVGAEGSAQGGTAPGRPPAIVRPPSAFVQIAANDHITIITPSVEMGQGGHTAMPMILMEELGGNWQYLKVEDAGAAAVYNNPVFGQQMTVGSFSVRGWYNELRRIGAAAREMLVQAAATQWQVPASECSAANSIITHGPSGKTCTYGSVAARAALLEAPQKPALKGVTQFNVIGNSKARVDVPLKVDGSAQYGIDVTLPDMLHAAVKTCPTFGGKLKSFDDSAAKKVGGYQATVALSDGVIVVARSWWQAKKALDLVTVEYDLGKLAELDSTKVSQILRDGFTASNAIVARNEGDVAAAMASAATVIEAEYEAPYLAHACMEPMNCTVRVSDEGCDIWCSTQAPQGAQRAAAAVLKIALDHIKVHSTYLGGGFGRRGESDYVTQAVIAAKAMGKPVKLLWTREEDIQHDFYRPAAAIRLRAAVDAQGKLLAVESNMVSASAPEFGAPGPPLYTDGVVDANYAIPNFRVTGLNKNIGIRFGFWRSVSHSHNPFMFEGFLDEIAARTKQDPYQFRRALLQTPRGERQLRVLDLVAEKAGWTQPKPGHFLGISAFEAFGSYIGTVCEISVKDKVVTLHRVVTAIDCGVAIHPDNIKAQLEGGMVYGLAAVLRGEITLKNGAVQQSNFHDYPMLLMAEMPLVESHIVPSTAQPGGIGEPGTGPIAPALANAIFAATGTRIRSLPLSKHEFTYATARA